MRTLSRIKNYVSNRFVNGNKSPWLLPEPMLEKLREPNATHHNGAFRSIHGGLWTDLDCAKDILESKLRKKSVSEDEAEKISYFIDHGYVILNNIIEDSLIDDFLQVQEKIKTGDIPGHYVEYTSKGKHIHGEEYTTDLIGTPFKLIDIYAKEECARKVNLHPKITRLLAIIFEQPPLAFQSLSFYTGSGQSFHQDTAYVRVDSPMELVATWIALEDVVPGSGELQFYDASQRLPDFNFSGNPGKTSWFPSDKSKWFDRKNFEEHKRYVQWLNHESQNRQLQIKPFHAKKGDVLFWTNDFVHGGAAIRKKHQSRLSLVTHYCPYTCNPYYFYTRGHAPKKPFGEQAFYTHVDHQSKPLPCNFDGHAYLKANPDVAKEAMNPAYHYIYYGAKEGRAIG